MRENSERLVCFDVDGTLVGKMIFVWQTLHEYFDTDAAQRKKAWDDYFAGRIIYSEWFEWDIRLLRERGANRQTMLAAIDGLELLNGVHETLSTIKDAGFRLAVVSGSLNIVLDKFDLAHYFDDVFLNELFFDKAGELIGWRPTPFDLENKAAGLDYLLAKYDLDRSRSVFVGDAFNDLSIARRAGTSIAINSTCQELIDCVTFNVEGDDLRGVLPHIL